MFTETSFEDWYAEVKAAFIKVGLTMPEDIELMELAHMECMAGQKSIADFVRETATEQNGNS